jgi:hypothetical protein
MTNIVQLANGDFDLDTGKITPATIPRIANIISFTNGDYDLDTHKFTAVANNLAPKIDYDYIEYDPASEITEKIRTYLASLNPSCGVDELINKLAKYLEPVEKYSRNIRQQNIRENNPNRIFLRGKCNGKSIFCELIRITFNKYARIFGPFQNQDGAKIILYTSLPKPYSQLFINYSISNILFNDTDECLAEIEEQRTLNYIEQRSIRFNITDPSFGKELTNDYLKMLAPMLMALLLNRHQQSNQ